MNETITEKQTVNAENNTGSATHNQAISTKKKGIIWKNWGRRDSLMVWEAVALSKNISPKFLLKAKERTPVRYRNYELLLETVVSWLNVSLKILDHPSNGIEAHDKMILLSEFVRCALSKNVELPSEMVEIATVTKNSSIDPTDIGQGRSKKKSPELEARDQELKSDAEALAQEAKSNHKRITKRKVAQLLSKQAKWSDKVSVETIERIILKTW